MTLLLSPRPSAVPQLGSDCISEPACDGELNWSSKQPSMLYGTETTPAEGVENTRKQGFTPKGSQGQKPLL